MEGSKNIKSGSGAQKRKIKKQKEEGLKKIAKIENFLIKSNSTVNLNSEQTIENERSERPTTTSENIIDNNSDFDTGQPKNEISLDTKQTHIETSDMGQYIINKNILDDQTKRRIISLNPHRPRGPFPKDIKQYNRSFNESYYYTKSLYGPVPRLWLCYSTILDSAYCEPCWLFSNANSLLRSGFREWKNLSMRIKVHSSSQKHIEACAVYQLWKKNKTIDKISEEEVRSKVSFWKMVLERLFRITLMLAKNSLAFRGHREELSEIYNGNFLSQVQLLAKYDNVMEQVVNLPTGSTKYLSPQIQNQLIHCLGETLLKKLTAIINTSPFYSLLLDTTQDMRKVDQLSVIIRYVRILRGANEGFEKFEIKETFLGFYELKDHSAKGMVNQIMQILKDLSIPIEKCYGQGYDGASVMSGIYSGVQSRIKQIQKNAEFVHCNSHNLNLVVNDSVSSCNAVSSFYTTLQSIYTFFGNSVNRWDLLSSFSGESEVTLKKLNPTRWSGRIQSITAVKIRFVDILKALTEISLKSTKKEERDEALQIKKNMTTFEFVFLNILLFKLMSEVNFASKCLQKQNIDLDEATTILNLVLKEICDLRNSFEQIKSIAEEQAKKWDIVTSFQSKRQRIVKRHFDELSTDHLFHNRESYFKINVFYYVIDQMSSQIRLRFAGMQLVKNYFGFLEPKRLLKMKEADILNECNNFIQKYGEIISPSFPNQFIYLFSLVKKDLKEQMSIRNFLELLLQKYSCIESEFTEIYTVFLLFLTLPVTVANVERSFSKLKIIKDYKRNSIAHDRLRDLALLAIESKEAAEMDLSNLITSFANAKARKKAF